MNSRRTLIFGTLGVITLLLLPYLGLDLFPGRPGTSRSEPARTLTPAKSVERPRRVEPTAAPEQPPSDHAEEANDLSDIEKLLGQ